MMAFDGEAFGKEIVGAVRAHVDRSLAPILERLETLEARQLERGADGADGKGADAQEVADLLAEDIERLIAEHVEKAVKALPAPKDGVGLAGAVIDRDGNLVITTTEGIPHNLGQVVGRDGTDGAKGDPGKDGTDALGFEDMDATYDGCRTITLRFARGDRVKEFAFEVPMVIDRGVYSQGREYSPGDGVTWAGSYWIAQEHTTEKPDGGKGWRLAVKRGRDGKDAERVAK